MHASAITLLSALALAAAQSNTVPVTGLYGNATVVTDNPVGITYTATLPKEAFSYPGPKGNVKGSITATANPNGVGVKFTVDFSNLPAEGGPFLYHLHVAPVPADGNCTETKAHLDPTARGEAPPCDPSLPETCQVGDLSGKHGKIAADPFTVSYTESYASTLEGLGAFFGNRSVVVHYANKTRITCANFVLSHSSSNGTATSTPIEYTPSPTPIQYVPGSGAAKTVVSLTGVVGLVGLAALIL